MTRAERKAAKAAAAEALLTQNLETTPIETLSDVVEKLDAVEGEVVDLAKFAEPAPVLATATANDFDTAIAAVSEADVNAKLAATVAAITERKDFELVKDATNTKIQKYLDGTVSKQLATKRAARVMCVANFDPSALNRVIHEGARYNVYAMGKLADAINGLSNSDVGPGVITNAINIACMKSLFRFRAAGVPYTGEMAKASASDKIRVERAVNEMLKRHTVSASTAPTQASSTMQALESLGIVSRTGSMKNPTFNLTTNAIVAKLETRLAA